MAALSATTILTNRIRMALVPRAVLEIKMQVSYELKQSQSRLFHELPSGLKMEVIFQKGRIDKDEKSQNPPLVFIHGSFHAAWCWAEHFLPFFCKHGYDCYALSLLGQGESDAPSGAVAGSLQTHANDIADFIQKQINFPPVLLGHSFGGLIVQYYIANIGNEKLHELWLYSNAIEPELCSAIIHGPRISIEILPYLDLILEKEGLHPYLAGAVLVCSVPPSGNSGIVWRYLFSKPVAAFKITRSLAAKAFQTSLPLCKETFFSAEMENQVVLRYQKLMTESSRMPLFDLRKLNASLPTPPVKDSSIKVLVLGAQEDFIVDGKGLEETATFYGVSPVCIEGVAHDIMLDCSWEKGAQVILTWLNHLKR